MYRGQLLLESGRHDEAIRDFAAALAIDRVQENHIRGLLDRRAANGESWAADALKKLGLR